MIALANPPVRWSELAIMGQRAYTVREAVII